MDLIITTEHRFTRIDTGEIYTQTQQPYSYWSKYLESFENIKIIARVKDIKWLSEKEFVKASGDSVEYLAVPYYVGPFEFFRNYMKIVKMIKRIPMDGCVIIIKMNSLIGNIVAQRMIKEKRPFGVEVIGDPFAAFSRGSAKYKFRILLKYLFFYNMKRICRKAEALLYVTNHYLQETYPAKKSAFSISCSDVELGNDAFCQPRKEVADKPPYELVLIGSLEQLYKGVDILIKSAHIVNRLERMIIVNIIGSGRYLNNMKKMAEDYGQTQNVRFLGQLPAGKLIRDELDRCDLFVIPSRTEGMPRALLEAMARGLPAIGSRVGGIPEVLEENELFEPNNPKLLAHKIVDILNNPERRLVLSHKNISKANEYRNDRTKKKLITFMNYLKSITIEK